MLDRYSITFHWGLSINYIYCGTMPSLTIGMKMRNQRCGEFDVDSRGHKSSLFWGYFAQFWIVQMFNLKILMKSEFTLILLTNKRLGVKRWNNPLKLEILFLKLQFPQFSSHFSSQIFLTKKNRFSHFFILDFHLMIALNYR